MFVLNNTTVAGSSAAADAATELQQLELELQRTVRRYRGNLATLQQPEEPRPEDTRALSSEVVRAFSSNAAQLVSCDACGEEMTAAQWRKHRETCSMKEVQCPLPGCNVVVEAGRLKQHFKRDCKVYRKRQQLVQQRLQKQQMQHTAISAGSITRRPPPADSDDDDHQHDTGKDVGDRPQASGDPVKRSSNQDGEESTPEKEDEATASRAVPEQRICPQCHKHVARSLQDHFMNDCVMVPVQCPNRPLGCDKTVPLFVLQAHLCNDCVGERVKDDMAKRAKERRSMIHCPGCGVEVMVMHLSSHQRNDCPNRKVPCRNWQFGCQRLVRAKDMDLHTMIDAALLPRAFLEFGGANARIVLDEEDVDPPWSVEFWLWRPEIEEELAKRLAEVQLYEKEYRVANANEAKQHQLIMDLTTQLQEAMTRWAETPSREMEAAKNEVMATLSSSVEQYEAAAFETTLSAHHLRLSINASVALMTELGSFEGRFEQFKERVDAGLFVFDTAPEANDQEQDSADDQNAAAASTEEEAEEENSAARRAEHERLDSLINRLAGRLIELDREAEELDKRRVDAGLIRSHESGRMPSSRSTGRVRRDDHSCCVLVSLMFLACNAQARSRNRKRTESAATVAKRIAESIAAKPGVNTLLSSSGGSIMLSAKDNRIGVYSSRTGLQVFNAECAREGWVHVAMVHTAPPNSRLILFLDGIRTAELHNVDLSLPMQLIGATANSFVGRICDVRYWGSELAPLEVASSMHQLLRLDEALKEKSLILWLSCEEGEGRTAADNSDQRYCLSLEGAFRWRRGEGSSSLPI